jgi:hypothetical protein
VPDTECEEWDTMKAWIKWDEWQGWCAEVQADGDEAFSPDKPVTILEEDDFNGIGRVVLCSQEDSQYNEWIPVRFISLEPITPDVW